MSTTLEHEQDGVIYQMKYKLGEVTNTPLYQASKLDDQMRFVEVWSSTIAEAVELYEKMKKRILSGYYSQSSK